MLLFWSILLLPFGFAEAGGANLKKLELRKWVMDRAKGPLASAPTFSDRAQDLVDPKDFSGRFRPFLSSVADLDKLKEGTVAADAWSDSYWPTYRGGIAFRYSLPNQGRSSDWSANFSEFSRSRPSLNELSPAEKYDLLVGDGSNRISNYSWSVGKEIYDEFGKVADWVGICHGSAPAADRVARPKKSVELVLADGTRLTFYPSDIKALVSHLWSSLEFSSRFIGGRCDLTKLNRDANGRVVEPNHPECEDSNPASFHLSVVNQIGDRKKALVMDTTNTDEVWNYPLVSYSFSYFNPYSGNAVNSWEEAKVDLASYRDPFKAYRSPQAVAIIGIRMNAVYMAEQEPSASPSDSRSNDVLKSKEFVYDLELNSAQQIVGGEWRSAEFPDFLWAPVHEAKPVTSGDSLAWENWDGVGPMPAGWKNGARRAGGDGQVLPKIVDLLVKKASE